MYGSPRIHAVLKGRGVHCGRKRVVRLMQELGLTAQPKRRRKPQTTKKDPTARFAPNILNRDFTAVVPNTKWATDCTMIPTTEGWLYLAVVLDLFSRRVVGWAMAPTEDEELVTLALRMALARRHIHAELLYHSDKGSEYTSYGYQELLTQEGIIVSMKSYRQLLRQCRDGVLFRDTKARSVFIVNSFKTGHRPDKPFLST